MDLKIHHSPEALGSQLPETGKPLGGPACCNMSTTAANLHPSNILPYPTHCLTSKNLHALPHHLPL
jgi:hypothetical protein